MSFKPIESNTQEAVGAVKKLYRENSFPFGYCVQMVAKNYGIDYSFLMSECGKSNKRNAPIIKKRTPEEAYGKKLPYWLRD